MNNLHSGVGAVAGSTLIASFVAAMALSALGDDPAKGAFTPAYAANQIQMWYEFKPEVIDRELAAARYFGINTLRVYLHNIVYDAGKEVFLQKIEAFLEICDRYGIEPGFTFSDDCRNHDGITINTPPAVDGRHNGRWAAPQDRERRDENLPKFKA